VLKGAPDGSADVIEVMSSADNFQQELEYLNVTFGFGKVSAPGVKTMPPQQKTMTAGRPVQGLSDNAA